MGSNLPIMPNESFIYIYILFKNGGIGSISVFREGDFFQGVAIFRKKKKTKIAGIFNEKKFINKNVLLCHN